MSRNVSVLPLSIHSCFYSSSSPTLLHLTFYECSAQPLIRLLSNIEETDVIHARLKSSKVAGLYPIHTVSTVFTVLPLQILYTLGLQLPPVPRCFTTLAVIK